MFKFIVIALLLVAGAAAICAAAWIYSPIAGLFVTGFALIVAGIVLSELFRNDRNS